MRMPPVYGSPLSCLLVLLAAMGCAGPPRGEARRLGLERQRRGDWEGAVEAFSAAIEEGHDPSDYRLRGKARMKLGDFQGAIADFDQVCRLLPDQAQGYLLRGRAKEKAGDYRGAVYDYAEAYAIDPANEAVRRAREEARRRGFDAPFRAVEESMAGRPFPPLPGEGNRPARSRPAPGPSRPADPDEEERLAALRARVEARRNQHIRERWKREIAYRKQLEAAAAEAARKERESAEEAPDSQEGPETAAPSSPEVAGTPGERTPPPSEASDGGEAPVLETAPPPPPQEETPEPGEAEEVETSPDYQRALALQEEAMAHYRNSLPGRPEADRHLREAKRLFEECRAILLEILEERGGDDPELEERLQDVQECLYDCIKRTRLGH